MGGVFFARGAFDFAFTGDFTACGSRFRLIPELTVVSFVAAPRLNNLSEGLVGGGAAGGVVEGLGGVFAGGC